MFNVFGNGGGPEKRRDPGRSAHSRRKKDAAFDQQGADGHSMAKRVDVRFPAPTTKNPGGAAPREKTPPYKIIFPRKNLHWFPLLFANPPLERKRLALCDRPPGQKNNFRNVPPIAIPGLVESSQQGGGGQPSRVSPQRRNRLSLPERGRGWSLIQKRGEGEWGGTRCVGGFVKNPANRTGIPGGGHFGSRKKKLQGKKSFQPKGQIVRFEGAVVTAGITKIPTKQGGLHGKKNWGRGSSGLKAAIGFARGGGKCGNGGRGEKGAFRTKNCWGTFDETIKKPKTVGGGGSG